MGQSQHEPNGATSFDVAPTPQDTFNLCEPVEHSTLHDRPGVLDTARRLVDTPGNSRKEPE